MENCKKYLTELVGTFFLVLTVVCTCFMEVGGVIAPLAIGSVLMIMVYAGGHVSGGHYNPAVSLAATIRGALPKGQLLPYVLAQLFGAMLAIAAFNFMAGSWLIIAEPVDFNTKGLLLAEFLFTFALCWVVLQTATSKDCEGNSYYGLAIGFTVMVGAFAVGGSLCYGAFNPAVALSGSFFGSISALTAGLTVAANLAGALCAAIVYEFTSNK